MYVFARKICCLSHLEIFLNAIPVSVVETPLADITPAWIPICDKSVKKVESLLSILPRLYSNEIECIKYITPAWPTDVVKTIYHCVLAFLSFTVLPLFSNHNYEKTMIFDCFPPA